jgi:uncharacterized protein
VRVKNTERNFLVASVHRTGYDIFMNIILLSDTHLSAQDTLPEELNQHLQDASLILHTGDLTSMEILKTLQSFAVTIAVYGNKDEQALVDRLPASVTVSTGGKSIGLIHGHRPKEFERIYREPELNYDSQEVTLFYDYLLHELPDPDVICFGHFHQAVVREYKGRLLINPGSANPKLPDRSFAVLEIGENGIKTRILPF